MKLPINWLKEYVDIKGLSAEELADRLTMAGQEIESVETDIVFEGVVIGEVVERIKHPNADKLNVAKVRVGKDTLQIVCGAPNLNVGQKVPVAIVGAKLGDFEIKKVELRGVESHGMICSEKELGIGEDHKGIMVLDKKAEVGADFGEYLGTEKVLDVKVMANRPDCMGMIGLAREVAATLGKKFEPKILRHPEFISGSKNNRDEILKQVQNDANDEVSVEIKDKDLCPRYIARVVKNVSASESPKWLQERLKVMGVRPINNLVDISNYVMLETGQPLHFFDLDKIKEMQIPISKSEIPNKSKKTKIFVRRATKGEEIVTLDGAKRKLTENMLVIADESRPIALAGVMGGENSEVDENTKNVLIEAAVFDKANIRRTSRSLGLRSEAVARFEKGIAYETPIFAIDRAADLLEDLAGGKISEGIVEASSKVESSIKIDLDLGRLNDFLGTPVPEKEVVKIFDNLGFDSKFKIQNSKLELTVPWWRNDIRLDADLYEEVARFWGYDKLPSTLPKTVLSSIKENTSQMTAESTRRQLADLGLYEIITYSFIGKKELEAIGEDVNEAPKVANPLVSEQEYMRTSLVPHMLMALADNQFLKEEISFFEIGKTFKMKKGQKLPVENKVLTMSVIGGKSWPINQKEGGNFYQLKGIIEFLLKKNQLTDQKISLEPSKNPIFEKGRAATVFVDGKTLAEFGEINKDILKKFDLKKSAGIALVNFDLFEQITGQTKVFQEFSKFPKIVRDISIILDRKTEVGDLVKTVSGTNDLIQKVGIVDIYEGKPLEKGTKSVTVRVEFQSDDRTLTLEEVDIIVKEINKKIVKLGGGFRV